MKIIVIFTQWTLALDLFLGQIGGGVTSSETDVLCKKFSGQDDIADYYQNEKQKY